MATASLKIISELLKEEKHPAMYKELGENVQFYLDPNFHSITFKQPGAVHHARFMAQSIYYMKIKILCNITRIASNAKTRKYIDAISEFVALFYAKWFLTPSIAVSLTRKDHEALSELIAYKEHSLTVA